eukprot:scaffold154_cov373-Prasinococcus_capsulatus_cf.AAC.21
MMRRLVRGPGPGASLLPRKEPNRRPTTAHQRALPLFVCGVWSRGADSRSREYAGAVGKRRAHPESATSLISKAG